MCVLSYSAPYVQETVNLIESTRNQMQQLAKEVAERERAAEAAEAGEAAQTAALERGATPAAAAAAAAAAAEASAAATTTAAAAVPTSSEIPLDLTVRLGMALLYLDRPMEARRHLAKLQAKGVEGYEDLYMVRPHRFISRSDNTRDKIIRPQDQRHGTHVIRP